MKCTGVDRIDNSYKTLCEGRGEYKVISASMIEVEITRIFKERYILSIICGVEQVDQ